MSETIDAIADGFERMLGTNGSVKTAVNLAAQRNMNGAESRLHDTRITLAERVILAGLDREAFEADVAVRETYPDVASAAKSLKKAHRALVESLAHDRWTYDDISTFAKDVQKIVGAVQNLR